MSVLEHGLPLAAATLQGERGGLAARLWQDASDLARAALEHPFVRGLASGTLPRAAFQRYVAQDAYFLEAFARAYALALARSPDREGLWVFADLLAGVQAELRLHSSYAGQWDIDLADVTPAPATLHYTDFLLATAALGDVGATCAAMTPCMRLYAWLGQTLVQEPATTDDHNPYAEWVRMYSGQSFEALAAQLEALLGRYAVETPMLRQTYRRAMQLEVAFFDASWQGAASGGAHGNASQEGGR